MIADMVRIFKEYIIGYSDHTLPDRMNMVLSTAWLLGAQVIEKHFTFDKSLKGNDHYHSMDKEDLKNFLNYLNDVTKIIGRTKKHYIESETDSRLYARRSLVAQRFIPKGKVIDRDDSAIKRLGTGVPPYLYHILIGAVATKDIQEDEIIKFGDFKVS
jgi:N-acetylneuraminate synthase